MDARKIGSVTLDETVFRKPTVSLNDKDGFVIKKWHPKPEFAWGMFIDLNRKWEQELNRLKENQEDG